MNPLKWSKHWQILLGLIIGTIIGLISGYTALQVSNTSTPFVSARDIVVARTDYLIFDLIGDLFMNALKGIIVPLVTSSIIVAVVGIGTRSGFGRLSLKTLCYYLSTSFIAITIGLILVNVINPGGTDSGAPLLTQESADQFEAERNTVSSKVGDKTAASFLDVFRKMIPANVVKAATDNGQLLGLIIVSILIGYFLTRIEGTRGKVVTEFCKGVNEITLLITSFILKFAPIGIGALIAATIAESYARLGQESRFEEFISGILLFSLTVVIALAVHFALVMPIILSVMARVNPLKHYKALAPALMTAFSTASSSATLPVTMDCVEHNAKVSNKTTSFVLPLGATVNMDGTALYECVAAIFIAQAFGVQLDFSQQFFVVIVALLTSIGVAGVPSASLVAIVIILKSLSLQLESQGIHVPLEAGLPILLVFDRLLDMCRTAVNIFSDSVGAIVIARSEGESNFYEEPQS